MTPNAEETENQTVSTGGTLPPSQVTIVQAPRTEPQPAKNERSTVELIKVLAPYPQHAEYVKALVEAETQRDRFDQDYRMARVYATSGKFDEFKGQPLDQAIAAAMAKIRMGRDFGMSDADSIAFIYFTNGKPAVMTEILATKIQEAGYNWDIDWSWADDTVKGKKSKRCTGCTLYLKQRSVGKTWETVLDRKGQPVTASFTEADAERAMIYENKEKKPLSEKWNFVSWPQDMYFWRAMSRLRKYYLTGILRGAIQYELRNDYVDIEAAPPEAAQISIPERPPLADRILAEEKG